VLLCQLLAGQAVGLRQHGLALVIEVLREHGQLRTSGVRIDSHPLILTPGTDGAFVLAPAAAGGASPAGLAALVEGLALQR
jgi:hypothetical protein